MNNYLYLLYKEIIEEKIAGISLKSMSFFNPIVFLKKLSGEKSIIHHHWYEFPDMRGLLVLLWKTIWMILYRLAGGKIIWTVHNRYPHLHRYRRLNMILRRWWAKIPQVLHVHCESAVDIMAPVLRVTPDKFVVHPHPDYPVKIINEKEAVQALSQKYFKGYLPENKIIFLMFGYIAEYKGIIEVVESFKQLHDPEKILMIAGAVKRGNESYVNRLQEAIYGVSSIYACFDLIPENEVHLFFNAARYAVFNYSDILTSGTVVLAKNYQLKMILSPMGCLKELKKEAENATIFFNNRKELFTCLENAR